MSESMQFSLRQCHLQGLDKRLSHHRNLPLWEDPSQGNISLVTLLRPSAQSKWLIFFASCPF